MWRFERTTEFPAILARVDQYVHGGRQTNLSLIGTYPSWKMRLNHPIDQTRGDDKMGSVNISKRVGMFPNLHQRIHFLDSRPNQVNFPQNQKIMHSLIGRANIVKWRTVLGFLIRVLALVDNKIARLQLLHNLPTKSLLPKQLNNDAPKQALWSLPTRNQERKGWPRPSLMPLRYQF